MVVILGAELKRIRQLHLLLQFSVAIVVAASGNLDSLLPASRHMASNNAVPSVYRGMGYDEKMGRHVLDGMSHAQHGGGSGKKAGNRVHVFVRCQDEDDHRTGS